MIIIHIVIEIQANCVILCLKHCNKVPLYFKRHRPTLILSPKHSHL